ncbi:MAG: M48 family metallopeptidase [Candidatus Thermoplasmatota archaeon]|nr:M48 family metallopeptidase [Candidatus Thermoplasmatota archaeon]MBU1941029.1 M48 family metallopeptidase [Candidatus Thermoplasmatota archaeon]
MKPFQIIRSARRKKTIELKKVDGVLTIYLPKGLNPAIEQKWIEKMIDQWHRHEKKRVLNSDEKLQQRAQKLNKEYFNGTLEYTIQFVANQQKRFGSCSPHSKMIRISNRIAHMPQWVQDYVILHELTHLCYHNHSTAFWKKVNEFPLTERARGYLIAVGLEPIEEEFQ